MSKKNVFAFKNVYKWEVKAIERRLQEKIKELKTETGKQKATIKAHNEIENVIAKYQALKGITYSNIKIEISVSWKKSYMWGYNPHAEVRIFTKTSSGETYYDYIDSTASGCGYDKLSSAIATALNQSMKLKSFFISKTRKLNAMNQKYHGTYGLYENYDLMGGCGVSCYRSIFEGLGFTWYHNSTDRSDFLLIEYKK